MKKLIVQLKDPATFKQDKYLRQTGPKIVKKLIRQKTFVFNLDTMHKV